MADEPIAALAVGQTDGQGYPVNYIYTKFAPVYAVYRSDVRVVIQFADDAAVQAVQRQKMAGLAQNRGVVSGLIDGWRQNKRNKLKVWAFDRRVADALIVGLEGEIDNANAILLQIRDDIIAERKAWARFLYLIWSGGGCLGLSILAGMVASVLALLDNRHVDPVAYQLLIGVGFGSLGAFFSIAIGLQKRSIDLDLLMKNNIIDSVVRILIGAIAAVVLLAMVSAGIVSVTLGKFSLGDGTSPHWLVTLIVCFLGGFSERLVPDLLQSAAAVATQPPQQSPLTARTSGDQPGANAPGAKIATEEAGASDDRPAAAALQAKPAVQAVAAPVAVAAERVADMPPAAASAAMAPAPVPIAPINFVGAGTPLTTDGFQHVVTALGVEPAVLWSVMAVETSGCGYLSDRRPQILFERHKFHEFTGGRWDNDYPDISNAVAGGYGPSGAAQYARLTKAMTLDGAAALQSTSWGLGQVLGRNFGLAGFDSVSAMVEVCVASEDGQLRCMARFIASQNLANALQSRDWAGFARRYNGADYAQTDYDGKLAYHFAQFQSHGAPDILVRACQLQLRYRNVFAGAVTGYIDQATTLAAKAFQAKAGLAPTGLIDDALLAALTHVPMPGA
jgi:hypothetical protein